MHYAVMNRCSKETDSELAQDLMILDLITSYDTPMPDANEVEIDDEVSCKLHLAHEVVGTEMMEEEGVKYEVEVTNKQDIIDNLDIDPAEWQEAKIHNCSHDEPINRPCSPWQICQCKGEIPEVEE